MGKAGGFLEEGLGFIQEKLVDFSRKAQVLYRKAGGVLEEILRCMQERPVDFSRKKPLPHTHPTHPHPMISRGKPRIYVEKACGFLREKPGFLQKKLVLAGTLAEKHAFFQKMVASDRAPSFLYRFSADFRKKFRVEGFTCLQEEVQGLGFNLSSRKSLGFRV